MSRGAKGYLAHRFTQNLTALDTAYKKGLAERDKEIAALKVELAHDRACWKAAVDEGCAALERIRELEALMIKTIAHTNDPWIFENLNDALMGPPRKQA